VEEAKRIAEAEGITNWKTLCRSQPPKLEVKLKTFISQIYMAAANELTNNRFFDVPALAKVIGDFKKEIGEKA
jgi:hypothetical protein